MSLTAVKCKMCDEHEMIPVHRKDGKDSGFQWCPNCDNPKGSLPQR
jgi:hypothetical protein